MLNKKNVPGLDGFVWWTGIVENRKDPLKLGRLQIRIFLWNNNDNQLLPSENLLWAHPIFPTNSSNEIGTLKEGDCAFGFYIDGDSAQAPFFFGRFPDIPEILYPPNKGFSDPGKTLDERPVEIKTWKMSKTGVEYENRKSQRYPADYRLNEPTTSRLARNENISNTAIKFVSDNMISGNLVGKEPKLKYNAKYPYNNSKESESGHYIDVDDTKDNERLFSMHRTGTFDEVGPDGTRHQKNCKDYWNVVHGTRKEYINNDYQLEVGKDYSILVSGNENINIVKDASINIEGNEKEVIGKNYSGTIKGNFTESVSGTYKLDSKGAITINSSDTININAPFINIKGIVNMN